MKSIVAIAFGLLLVVQAQVMLPHRKAINSGNPFNAGPNGTNLLGGAIGEQPVLFSNQIYLANWNYYAGTSGLSVVDCETVQTVKFIQVTNSWTDHAPLQDAYGKWHLYAQDGGLYRIDAAAETVLAGVDAGTFGAVDWETPCFSDGGNHIIMPRTTDGSGIVSVAVTNYSTTIWTNTDVYYNIESTGLLTPSILHARTNLWVLDHHAKLWKLNDSDGSTVSSIQPFVSSQAYQYSSPIYDYDHDQIYYSDADNATYYALDPAAMTNKWSYKMGGANWWAWRPPCYYADRVYFLADWRDLTPHRVRTLCLNATNGSAVWENDYCMENALYCGAPFMDNDYFYLSTYDSLATNLCNLVAIDRTTGRMAGLFHEDFNASSGVPQEWKGKIFLPHWSAHGLQAVKFRASGLADDKLWKANTNYTGNVGANGSGALNYPTNYTYNLSSNLVAWWTFDEASGNWTDVVGGLILTNTSGTYQTGIITNAAQFTTSQYAKTASAAPIVLGTNGYTIAFWIYWNGWNSGAASQVIFRKGDGGGADYLMQGLSSFDGGCNCFRWVDVASSGAYGFNYSLAGGSEATIANSKWYFVVVWDDRANNTVYMQINMLTPVSTPVAGYPVDGGRPLWISSVNGASNWMQAKVDELAFWDRALSLDERTALYNVGRAMRVP